MEESEVAPLSRFVTSVCCEIWAPRNRVLCTPGMHSRFAAEGIIGKFHEIEKSPFPSDSQEHAYVEAEVECQGADKLTG